MTDWKGILMGMAFWLGVVALALLMLAWTLGFVHIPLIPYDHPALENAPTGFLPRVFICLFAVAWVFFLRQWWRRGRVKRKYPYGFRHDGKLYIPLRRKKGHGAEQDVPVIGKGDVRLIDELSLHYDTGDENVIYYGTGIPDMGYGGYGQG